MELGRSAPMLTWASPGRAAAMVPARQPSCHPTRAREALMMAGAGGAMRATGWRHHRFGARARPSAVSEAEGRAVAGSPLARPIRSFNRSQPA